MFPINYCFIILKFLFPSFSSSSFVLSLFFSFFLLWFKEYRYVGRTSGVVEVWWNGMTSNHPRQHEHRKKKKKKRKKKHHHRKKKKEVRTKEVVDEGEEKRRRRNRRRILLLFFNKLFIYKCSGPFVINYHVNFHVPKSVCWLKHFPNNSQL